MDCFVAEPVIGRAFRATRWLPCANALRLSQAMRSRYASAISPRMREFYFDVRPSEIRGRRECRALDAPAAACGVVESTRVSHHGHTGNTRHSPRNGFTAYSALSPVTGLSCHRHP